MIPQWIMILSIFATFVTGVTVLALGDWRRFKLKFAALILSTITAAWLSYNAMLKVGLPNCKETLEVCLQWEIFYIARNVAILLFQIGCGRDAMHVKHKDRRAARV